MNPLLESLHILRKDVRRLWLALLLWLVGLFSVCLLYPRTWADGFIDSRIDFVLCVPPIFAWLLIHLAVLQEPLVSDRSYWLTRPYRRSSLLAAKILFYILAIALPVLCMQMVLVRAAGMPVLRYMPRFLLNLVTLSIFPLIFFAAATVVRKISTAIFVLLGTAAYIGLVAGIYNLVHRDFDPSFSDGVQFLSLILVSVAVIIIQYFSRRTAFSRALLILCCVAISIAIVVPMPNLGARILYPAQPSSSGVALHFDEKRPTQLDGKVSPHLEKVRVYIPVVFTGVPPDHIISVQGQRFHIKAGDGSVYDSGWQAITLDQVIPGESNRWFGVFVPAGFYRKLENAPADITLDLAVEHTEMEKPHTYTLSDKPVEVADIGTCQIKHPLEGDSEYLRCASAVDDPLRASFAAQLSTVLCDQPGINAGPLGQDGVWGDYERSFPFSLPAAGVLKLSLSKGVDPNKKYHLCPGALFVVRRIHLLGHNTISLHAKALLKNYVGDPIKKQDENGSDSSESGDGEGPRPFSPAHPT